MGAGGVAPEMREERLGDVRSRAALHHAGRVEDALLTDAGAPEHDTRPRPQQSARLEIHQPGGAGDDDIDVVVEGTLHDGVRRAVAEPDTVARLTALALK